MIELLVNRLVKEEGYRQFPYRCTADKLTIGIGRNIQERGISLDEAKYLAHTDINNSICELLEHVNNYEELNYARQIVLIDMCFNLGITQFLKFRKFIAAVENGEFEKASEEMLDSLWAKQVGERATKLAEIMKTGIYSEY
jgi:lysozyme